MAYKAMMSDSRKPRRGARARDGYHHGNLKAALIDAALSLIAEKGANGFTFADAARRAGVSPAAPYRHFKDRDHLIEEVARRGFEAFADDLETAWDNGQPTPLRAFEAVGRAYLRFARENSAFFAAMFESGVAIKKNPALAAEADRAFDLLLRATDVLLAQMPAKNRPPVRMASYHIWAQTHGVATLFSRGDPGRRSVPISADDLLESGVALYLKGIGFFEG